MLDNVRVGCHRGAKAGFADPHSRRATAPRRAPPTKRRATFSISSVSRDLADEPASNLPHGHQRALGMAVALAADPKLLLLDEPFTGMNPEETRRMAGHVRQLRDERGVTIMLVEHDMQAVMGLCDIITVMNFGSALARRHAGRGPHQPARDRSLSRPRRHAA